MTDNYTMRVAHNKDNPYFMMNRDTAQDRALSWEARGMLAYLLSKPDGWQTKPSDLKQQCGRDKAYKILNELIAHKYMTLTINCDDHGRVVNSEYMVCERPFPEKPDTDLPDTVNTDSIKYREEESTESTPLQSVAIAPSAGVSDPSLNATDAFPSKKADSQTANTGTQTPPKVAGKGSSFYVSSAPGQAVGPFKTYNAAKGYAADTGTISQGVSADTTITPPPDKPPRPRNPVFDAIAFGAYGMTQAPKKAGYLGTLTAGVIECTIPGDKKPTAEQLQTLANDIAAMYVWYKTAHPELSGKPAKVETICKYLAEWRDTGSKRELVEGVDFFVVPTDDYVFQPPEGF